MIAVQSRWNGMPKIKSIKYIGKEECQCIKVSAKDEMYVTDEKILTHNTIIYCAMSEIAWWRQAGWTNEQIKRFFDKACQRVDSRMNGNYLGRYVIDSSPFSMESPIDKWIWETAIADPKWYCVLGSKWDYFKNEFPEFYDKNGNEIHNWDVAFQVYKGGKSEPPKTLQGEEEAALYDPLDLIWCPKHDIKTSGITNLESVALQNTTEFLRDWAGIPAGSADRIFAEGRLVEAIFDNGLRNIYTAIVADADDEPEHLIWNQIKDQFFINFNNTYLFYREPNVKRVIAIDQSISGDATAITMSHWEYVRDKEKDETKNVVVVDFNIVIIPKGKKINLDAIRYFLLDLIDMGNINIGMVNFDSFQSETTKQALRRRNIPVDYISADKKNEPYQSLIDYITHERFFAGKNIFLKNNLRSIHWTKRDSGSTKVDHFNGKIVNESDDTNWDTSQLGVNAKDVADTCAECLTMLLKNDIEFAPTTEWVNTKDLEKGSVKQRLENLGFSF